MKKVLVIVILLFTASFVTAQHSKKEPVIEFSTGVDFVSGFIWRGLNLGSSPAIQPNASISAFGFELAAFGSYALIASEYHHFDKVPYTEFDLELKYSMHTKAGEFSLLVSDIFLPYEGLAYSNFDGVVDNEKTGAHDLGAGIEYEGPEHFPISFRLEYHFHNDPNRSIYGELGYRFACGETDIRLFFGAAMGTNGDLHGSEFYEIEEDEIGIINVGATISKEIKVTDSFSIPLNTSVVFNPYANAAYLVVSLSL